MCHLEKVCIKRQAEKKCKYNLYCKVKWKEKEGSACRYSVCVVVSVSKILFYVYLYYLQRDNAFKLQLGKKSGVTSRLLVMVQ